MNKTDILEAFLIFITVDNGCAPIYIYLETVMLFFHDSLIKLYYTNIYFVTLLHNVFI